MKLSPIKKSRQLQNFTLRGASGGLNLIDDDMNLSPKFATVLENVVVDADGSVDVRFGVKLFAQTSSAIVNVEYFNNHIISVDTAGLVKQTSGTGNVDTIFNTTIANALSGSPDPWSATAFASFASMQGKLHIANGIDKPLEVDENLNVSYLQDAATLTNINVPTCKYIVVVGNYMVMLGDPLFPRRVHISARNAPGTWFGDPAPNDATRFDVDSLSNGAVIRGALSFRNKLLILFAEGTVVYELGNYDASGNHEPALVDTIEGYGSVSHRAAVASGDDGLLVDQYGVPSIRRTVLSTSFKPERVSELVDPDIVGQLSALTAAQMDNDVFRVYDPKQGHYMLFVPNAAKTESRCYVYHYKPSIRQNAWSIFTGWNFVAGCRSLLGNIFFADSSGNIWLYGSKANPIYADFVDTISGAPTPEGRDINFNWTTPWLDIGNRALTKSSRYVSLDTRGSAEFNLNMYVDNFKTSSLTMGFSGGEQGLFGDGDQPYGGGRNTSFKKLYGWTAKFQLAKFEVSGSTKEKLGFVGITMHYFSKGIRA